MPRPFLPARQLSRCLAVLVITSLLATPAQAQEKAVDGDSLARYVPKDNLIYYLEYDGLDAHFDPWKRTAAYKILNETSTGAMLEELGARIFEKLNGVIPTTARNGSEPVAMIKHLARSGFLHAMILDPENTDNSPQVLVLRNAFKDKTMRASMARELQSWNAPNIKPEKVTVSGHSIIKGVAKGGKEFAWWVEESKKEDIVIVFGAPKSASIILETLDGKRPTATTNGERAELLKPVSGFIGTGLFFFNSQVFSRAGKPASALALAGASKIDYRWGFQDDALMSITRITTAGPRQGIWSLLNGPSFDKGKLLPIPDSVTEFTVVALDLKTAIDKILLVVKTLKPDAEEQVTKFTDQIKTLTKLRLKEDILTHLGPKVAFYTVPAKAGAKPNTPTTGMLSTIMSSIGGDQIPKAALVFDIDDAVAFNKVLDQIMAAVNKELKSRAAAAVAGAAGGDTAPAKGSRNKGPSVPSIEFRLMPGETRMYAMTVPPELSNEYPTSFRPAIRVGPKYAVIGITAEVARLVLESKGNWTAPGELSKAMDGLPSNLKVLSINDPRDTLPPLLAALPGNLQKAINGATQIQASLLAIPGAGLGAAPAAPGATPGGPGAAPAPTPSNSGDARGRRPGMAGPGTPDPGKGPAAPGGPGLAGSPGATATPGALVLQVDASKLPSAEAIKALLYPSVLSVDTTDTEIKIVTRSAFPAIPDFSKFAGIAQLAATWQGLGGLLKLAPPTSGAAGPENGAKPGAAPPGGVQPPGRGPR